MQRIVFTRGEISFAETASRDVHVSWPFGNNSSGLQ